MLIDSHQHFWSLGGPGFEWPTPDLTSIYRKFGPEDLIEAAGALPLAGTVLIQSQPSLSDTEWLLEVASEVPLVKAVVGWVDFESADVVRDIERLAAHLKFRGVRPMLQNLPDDDWVMRPQFDDVFDFIASRGLTLDALVFPRHLPFLKARILKHPSLKVIIDHGGKPQISKGEFTDWAASIAEIAQLDQVFCKLSGLTTEMGKDQKNEELQPYITKLVDCFGAQRLMWGSDWPVVNLNSSYQQWFETATSLSGLSDEDLARLCGGTAVHFYSII